MTTFAEEMAGKCRTLLADNAGLTLKPEGEADVECGGSDTALALLEDDSTCRLPPRLPKPKRRRCRRISESPVVNRSRGFFRSGRGLEHRLLFLLLFLLLGAAAWGTIQRVRPSHLFALGGA